MKKIQTFLFLHIKKQLMMYLLPFAFVYFILVPYQQQVFAVVDVDTMAEVYDISQKYICLFFIWYQYLSWRYVLAEQQREVVKFESFRKASWFILNVLFTNLLLSAYYLWLINISDNKINIVMLLVQYFFSAVEVTLLFHVIESSLFGLVIYLAYLFLCITKYIPDGWSVIRLGIMPSSYGAAWVWRQFLCCTLLAGWIKIKRLFPTFSRYF